MHASILLLLRNWFWIYLEVKGKKADVFLWVYICSFDILRLETASVSLITFMSRCLLTLQQTLIWNQGAYTLEHWTPRLSVCQTVLWRKQNACSIFEFGICYKELERKSTFRMPYMLALFKGEVSLHFWSQNKSTCWQIFCIFGAQNH